MTAGPSRDRAPLAWAVATVPFVLYLGRNPGTERFTAAAVAAVASAAILIALARSVGAGVVATVACAAAASTIHVDGLPPLPVPVAAAGACLALLAGAACGVPRGARPSAAFAVPVITAAVLLVADVRFAATATVTAVGLGMWIVALAAPSAWETVERRLAPVTATLSAAARLLRRPIERIVLFAARGVAAVTATLAFVLVVAVPSVVRFVGVDPLWAPRRRGSRWVPRPRDEPLLPQRLFVPDPGPPGLRRARTALGLVATVGVVAAVAVGAAALTGGAEPDRVSILPEESDGPQAGPDGSARQHQRAQPWFDDVEDAVQDAATRGRISQFVGLELADVSTDVVQVRRGVRRSWTPPSTCPTVLTVWAYGGGAMFGVGQRDDDTIASWLARVAHADGVGVEVLNRAVPGDVAWQERERLARDLARSAHRPDAVVFYDGHNDLLATHRVAATGRDVRGEMVALTDHELMPLLNRFVNVEQGERALRVVPAPGPSDAPIADADAVLDTAVAQYAEAHRSTAELLGPEEIPALRFLQPSAATRSVSHRGDAPSTPAERDRAAALRARRPPDVVDLGSVLDDWQGPAWADAVNAVSAANRRIAESIWRSITSTLGIDPGGHPCS